MSVAFVSGGKEGRRLSLALSPAQRFGALTLRALVSVRVSRVLQDPSSCLSGHILPCTLHVWTHVCIAVTSHTPYVKGWVSLCPEISLLLDDCVCREHSAVRQTEHL